MPAQFTKPIIQWHIVPQNCTSHYNETCLSMQLKKAPFSPALIRMNVAHSIIWNVQHGGVFYLVDCVWPNQRHPLPLGNQNDVRPFQKAHKPCKATSVCNRRECLFFKCCKLLCLFFSTIVSNISILKTLVTF